MRAVGIHEAHASAHQRDAWTFVEKRDLAFKPVRKCRVVGVETGNIGSGI